MNSLIDTNNNTFNSHLDNAITELGKNQPLYKYDGCFRDDGSRMIPKYNGSYPNINTCYNLAKSKNHTVFGVQYGGECWTGTDMNKAKSLGNGPDCGSSLGGGWTNQVHSISPNPSSSTPEYTYQGCFRDNGSRMIPVYNGYGYDINGCYNVAKSKNHTVFGLQYYGQCFTGTNLDQAKALGDGTSTGQCANQLGGAWTNQVYTTSSATAVSSANTTNATNSYNSANNIYTTIYNQVYEAIKQNSAQGVTNSSTASATAQTNIGIDTSASTKAQLQATKTSINSNQTESSGIKNQNTTVTSYNNSVLQPTNIISAYDNANNAKNLGLSLNTQSNSLQVQAKELEQTAIQEERRYTGIAQQNTFNTVASEFASKYTTALNNAQTAMNGFFTNVSNVENNTKQTLNTTLEKSPLEQKLPDNISIEEANRIAQEFEKNSNNNNYQFVNFTVDSAIAYPSKCLGVSENSNTQRNMTLLDNNLHTYTSCKISSNLANKPYFALVKPNNSTGNLYNCYVSDSATLDRESNRDYVIIWQHGPKTSNPPVSNFRLDICGNFIVTYTDNTTAKITDINPYVYDGCNFYLELLDTGNMKINAQGCRYTDVPQPAWQLFSLQEVQRQLQSILGYGPVYNHEWASKPAKAPNTLTPQTPPTNLLISPNGYYKLEVTTDGNLQLKTTIYGCKYTEVVDGSSNIGNVSNTRLLYTDSVNTNVKGQPYYVYANDTRTPSIETPYYSMNIADSAKTLDRIEWTHPFLKNTDDFVPYTGYSFTSDNTQIQNETNVANSAMDCQTQCKNDRQCNYVYYNNNKCHIGKQNIPKFIPNNNSTLYIRKKRMDMSNNPSRIEPGFINKNNSLEYSRYNIRTDPITTGINFGYTASNKWQQANSKIQKFLNGTEGFYNYGYNDALSDCSGNGSSIGCNKAIQRKQIAPLQRIARDYQGQLAQMETNQTNLQNTINQYNETRNILNKSEKYDFSGNQHFTMEDTSIQNAMQQDTKQLLLQQNDFYIAGSILTTTLLIGAIYLAR